MDTMEPFLRYSDTLNSFLKGVEITDIRGDTQDLDEGLSSIITHLRKVKSLQKKVMILGNGGSAAIASHLQNDLCKASQIRAMVFTEPPLLTALSNDISYTAAYGELVNLWGDNGDVLISISSSGKSPNMIEAVRRARERDCSQVITMSGFQPDNPLRQKGDFNIYAASSDYGYVELTHSVLAHYISDQISKIK